MIFFKILTQNQKEYKNFKWRKAKYFGLTVFESNEFLTTGQRNYERCLHLLRSFPRSLSCYFICYGGQIGHKNLHGLFFCSTLIRTERILLFPNTISFQQTRFNTLVESSDRSRCTSIRKTFILSYLSLKCKQTKMFVILRTIQL